MLAGSLTLLLMYYHVCNCQMHPMTLTTMKLVELDQLHNVAAFGDAAHRGPQWQDESSDQTSDTDSYLRSDLTGTESSLESSDSSSSSSDISSKDVSSLSTKEKVQKTYRECTPCPQDMLKTFKNMGIKWICGGYQRARRSFKSVCMMRFRNCQDGTMFVKLYDHRCKDDMHHGRNWFYIYRV